MSIEQKKIDLSKLYIEKSRNTYEEAVILRDSNKYLGASNRLYYAFFYLANAFLALKGLSSRKHSGVRSLFDLHFVKTKLVDKRYSRIYNALKEIREDSDYECFYLIDKQQVDENFEYVKEFIDATKNFVNSVEKDEIELET